MKPDAPRAPDPRADADESAPVPWTLPAELAAVVAAAKSNAKSSAGASASDRATPGAPREERRQRTGPVPRRDPGAATAPSLFDTPTNRFASPSGSSPPPQPMIQPRANRRVVALAFGLTALLLVAMVAGALWWLQPWQSATLGRETLGAPLPAALPAALPEAPTAMPAHPAPDRTMTIVVPPVTDAARPIEPPPLGPLDDPLPPSARPTSHVTVAASRPVPPPAKPHVRVRDPRCSEFLARQSLGDATATRPPASWNCQ